jgi:folate-binding protein YgfZ
MSAEARALQSLAVVRVGGPDAESFLQGQLTSDIARLDSTTQLAACTTPQGRVIAILRIRRHEDAIYLLVPAVLRTSLVERLRKFVLRARVRIELLDAWSVTGVHTGKQYDSDSGPSAESVSVAFEYPDGRIAIARPGATSALDGVADEDWQRADIAAGLPQILAETTGHFIPQMLNLDLLGAVSFTKGCYTGQEIVARTQHLGRIKRRTLRYAIRAADPPAPLTALNLEANKVGEVLIGARVEGGAEILAVVSLETRDRPLRTATGHTAVHLGLPYPA